MYLNNWNIFCCKPNKVQSRCKIVARLLVFLKRIWKDKSDIEKLNILKMLGRMEKTTALPCMHADTELDQILEHGQVLIFLDMVVQVDTRNTTHQNSSKTECQQDPSPLLGPTVTSPTQNNKVHPTPCHKLTTPYHFAPSLCDDQNNAFGKICQHCLNVS